jgi:hypothetical protein
MLDVRLVEGFAAVLVAAVLVDKLGDMLYRKGIARPFYVFGRRLHHKKVVLTAVPALYAVVALLIYAHYVRILWYAFWVTTDVTVFLAGACLAFDMVLDAILNSEKRRGILHHEWLYLIVPAYVFTHLVVLV